MVKPLESCHLSLEVVIKAAVGRKPFVVELTRYLEYFNRENTVFKRSHSSERTKCQGNKGTNCRSVVCFFMVFNVTWVMRLMKAIHVDIYIIV